MTQSVIVHGHFYQPPRENPWRDAVDVELSAAPFHDWNERITHECYEPVSNAKLLDAKGDVDRRINLFEWLSFDAGTTLLRWLERQAPATYAAIVEGDRQSARRLGGHGNAIAMPYHHLILPLASRRDKVTEVRWGLAEFRRRFGRESEGMWLPETAVDEETLDVLAAEGVRFTILAPHQVDAPEPAGDVLMFKAGNRREIALCTYDGALSAGVAFGKLLDDGAAFARRLAQPPVPSSHPQAPLLLTALATDGETFGHHHKFAEMGLARAISMLGPQHLARVENFGSLLARAPKRRSARLISPSSWSCPHGVERWRSNCGCNLTPGTSQAWRGPLRSALDWLAAQLETRITTEATGLFDDPLIALDEYGSVAAMSQDEIDAFVQRHARAGASTEPAARLLAGATARLGMFGSCAWFFDDIAGHEAVLMLRIAAYAIDQIGAGAIEEEIREEACGGQEQRCLDRRRSRRVSRASPDGASSRMNRYAGTPARDPVMFVFGVHLHQPVGNFGEVFADHARDVYRPLIEQIARRRLAPALFHMSGPLLEWLIQHDAGLVDDLGRLASDGRIEFLLGGMYEPILAAIPRADRVEQIVWLREALLARFGVCGDGLWLTERVWEPDLPFDLATAGVRYVLLDDRHFLVTGFSQAQLHVPWRTESNGRGVSVLAIDQRLRYLIPFRPPEEIAEYMRRLYANGDQLAVFADDGEKFGGWPGTKEWVYGRGWFDRFCDTLDQLQDEGIVRIVGGAEAIARTASGGLAYLPTASYHEMEGWALPAKASVRLTALEEELGKERMEGPDGALIRGSHWKNFLARYPESNRIHKKMLALSSLCRSRGDPPLARRAVARAQCNDALWHGVFGGLYLPHLREALWRQLAIAEGALRQGQALEALVLDFDADGEDEVWIHSSRYSAIIAPARGGAMIELTDFAAGFNYADTLTRRLEAYHLPRTHRAAAPVQDAGTPSIHELEASLQIQRPPIDLDDRAIGVARLISGDVTAEAYELATYEPIATWARARCTAAISRDDTGAVVVRCLAGSFGMDWRFAESGAIEGSYHWDTNARDATKFAIELSVAHGARVECPGAADTWRYGIETYAKSERGMDRTRQGDAIVLLFDGAAGGASFTIHAASETR